jgi:predicted alpha/beta-hydrolase family hydrolase
VTALFDAPSTPAMVYVLAHGAGAGKDHPFLAEFAALLVAHDVAVLRYNFPYMDAGRNRVDPGDVTSAVVRAAVSHARDLAPGVPCFAGGKSFGGRMTSEAQSREPLAGVVGLAFLGFPLHPPDKPGTTRAAHLANIRIPMLFLQGDRDEFARHDLLQATVAALPTATLTLIPDGDHSFKVRKKLTGKSASQVMGELADRWCEWATSLSHTNR